MFWKLLNLCVLCHFLTENVLFPISHSKESKSVSNADAIMWSLIIILPIMWFLPTSGINLLLVSIANASIYYVTTDALHEKSEAGKNIIKFLQIVLTLLLFLFIL